jgi:hypothetical protein
LDIIDPVSLLCGLTKRLTFQRLLTAFALLGIVALAPARTCAEEIDFGQINKFESLATGTLHVGAPLKTIVDDGERHAFASAKRSAPQFVVLQRPAQRL